MASAGSLSQRLQSALSSLQRQNPVKYQFHPDVFIQTLEELQTSFKEHAQSILTDENGKQRAHDIEVVGYNSMIQVLDASIGDLNKRLGEATFPKVACATDVERGLLEAKERRDMLSTVRSEQAELGVKTIESPQSQTMEKFVAQFHDDKAHSSECIVGEPVHVPILPLREDKAISPSESLLDRGRDSDDDRDELGLLDSCHSILDETLSETSEDEAMPEVFDMAEELRYVARMSRRRAWRRAWHSCPLSFGHFEI